MKLRAFLLCLLVGFSASELATAAPAPTHETLRVTEKILYRFEGGSDGAHPESGVVMDSAGNLYGTTYGTRFIGSRACGACGTVFEISTSSRTETLLHAFSGGDDGAHATAGLILDGAGNLYGVTQYGGSGCITAYVTGCGTVFEIPAHSQSEMILHSFSASDGWAPDGGLIADSPGDLYGTTSSGGCLNGFGGCGTVFEIAAGTRKETVLHTFARGGDIEGFPKGRLIMDRSGNVYGTTWMTNLQSHISGTLFEIVAGTREAKILHTFAGGRDGDTPNGDLVVDRKGDLYGTTQFGGGFCDSGSSPGVDAMGCGTVFEISAGTRKETIWHHFNGGSDGMDPRSGLTRDSAGNVYGTTYSGGVNCPFGCGTVFEIAAGTRKETVLYRFKGGRDGAGPEGELFMDSAGNLYGTTFGGGSNCQKRMELGPGCGTVFEIIHK
ncbi:MAG: choice-of-anchor tandem repeat GloVer-containing protein [Candidatus Sulfotelmatobacter sp.]